MSAKDGPSRSAQWRAAAASTGRVPEAPGAGLGTDGDRPPNRGRGAGAGEVVQYPVMRSASRR